MSPRPAALIDFPGADGARGAELVFDTPERVLVAHRLEDVRPVLREAVQAARGGLYAVGYVGYEAAPAFDRAISVRAGHRMPLAWFGIFRASGAPRAGRTPDAAPRRFSPAIWEPSDPRPAYDDAIARIRDAIGAGDMYQVNHTIRLRARLEEDPIALYDRLRRGQGDAYAAYLDIGRFRIVSASPELFFRCDGQRITARPMKGTARRGRFAGEDEEAARSLAASAKDRAENLMILDLLRNDLGRVAAPGSVHARDVFAVERYRTVWQMTSTVEAERRAGATIDDVFAALFPCGSVTGAPKVAATRRIAALETSPREVYCGAVGVIGPGDRAVFNVPIRTAWIDAETGDATYGAGGGVTWDSTAPREYDELLAKAAILRTEWPSFELLETLRLVRGEYTLIERHLDRLEASARYFGFPPPRDAALAALAQGFARADAGVAMKVRLLVTEDGAARIEMAELGPDPWGPEEARPVALAREPVDSSDPFLFHKTTHRGVHERRRADHPAKRIVDVILWNERGELTELTTGNLVLEIDGRRWTPPVTSGLLAGTMRAELLGVGVFEERVLPVDALRAASKMWLVNSVRGMVPVRLAT